MRGFPPPSAPFARETGTSRGAGADPAHNGARRGSGSVAVALSPLSGRSSRPAGRAEAAREKAGTAGGAGWRRNAWTAVTSFGCAAGADRGRSRRPIDGDGAVCADAGAAAVPAACRGEPVGRHAGAADPLQGAGVDGGYGHGVGEPDRGGQGEGVPVEQDAGVPGVGRHPRLRVRSFRSFRSFRRVVRTGRAGEPGGRSVGGSVGRCQASPTDFSQACATSSGSLFSACTWVSSFIRVAVSSLAETASSASTPFWGSALL